MTAESRRATSTESDERSEEDIDEEKGEEDEGEGEEEEDDAEAQHAQRRRAAVAACLRRRQPTASVLAADGEEADADAPVAPVGIQCAAAQPVEEWRSGRDVSETVPFSPAGHPEAAVEPAPPATGALFCPPPRPKSLRGLSRRAP